MKSIAQFLALLFLGGCGESIPATPEDEVRNLVREYFGAFQEQDWEQIVEMMHPKSLEEIRNGILADVPKSNGDSITDDKKSDVQKLLTMIEAKTAEDASALRPKLCISAS